MTKSVYVLGGAGTGKSTFTARVLTALQAELGPLQELAELPNKKNVVTLRGHVITCRDVRGMYLGKMRDLHPGTDGLDRASSPVAASWVANGRLPDFILAEGATLATRKFLAALHENTHLLVVHLWAEEWLTELRLRGRGTSQDPKFVANTVTRSAGLVDYLLELGAQVRSVDTSDPTSWSRAVKVVSQRLAV
jgi:hypothetical protein